MQQIKDNPQTLVGAIMLCPHCDRLLKVIKVSTSINAAYDPSGRWNAFVLIQLEDEEWARFWLDEYPDYPRDL